jgi:hypothetical protein
MNCHFCNFDVTTYEQKKYSASRTWYHCPICGEIKLTEEAAEDFEGEQFSERDKKIISCVLRNEYENRGNKPPDLLLDLHYLHRVVDQYVPLTPLDKLDYALQRLNKLSQAVGDRVGTYPPSDYPLFHCFHHDELNIVLKFLQTQQLVNLDHSSGGTTAVILPKGYERLQRIQQSRQDSTTCFVAMWFDPNEMGKVYEEAIKLAIEYKEEGKEESRFKAIMLDNVEHINNINDEIIATIRRSRFMVCDLTGYRGGVYFEAGFAQGLGLQVIYTCRKDWCSEDKLKGNDGRVIETLKDTFGRQIRVRKEGVHFDLAHMNRIEWEDGEKGLKKFKDALEKRIKAVIV